MIGTQDSTGVRAIYCHYDGYPEDCGQMLLAHYTAPEVVASLIDRGDCSAINEHPTTCDAYADRGETDVDARTYTNHHFLLDAAKDCDAKYVYLFREGEWVYFDRTDPRVKARKLTPFSRSIQEYMRIVAISDTHTMHRHIKHMPEGDILLVAGDITGRGAREDVLSFSKWLQEIEDNYGMIVVVPGNHDFLFENDWAQARACFPDYISVLNQELLEYNGVKIWGEPRQPEFFSWAFNVPRRDMAEKCWDKIPSGIDILLTHGPPFGACDVTDRLHESVGCEAQSKWILENQPKLVVCGHIHEGYGMGQIGNTAILNVSICNKHYSPVNKPVVFDLQENLW